MPTSLQIIWHIDQIATFLHSAKFSPPDGQISIHGIRIMAKQPEQGPLVKPIFSKRLTNWKMWLWRQMKHWMRCSPCWYQVCYYLRTRESTSRQFLQSIMSRMMEVFIILIGCSCSIIVENPPNYIICRSSGEEMEKYKTRWFRIKWHLNIRSDSIILSCSSHSFIMSIWVTIEYLIQSITVLLYWSSSFLDSSLEEIMVLILSSVVLLVVVESSGSTSTSWWCRS